MSILQANGAGLGGAGDPGGALGSFYGTTIDQSLRFNDDDGPNLTQTYGGSPTSTALGTFSWWMKLGNVPSKSQENIYFESAGAGGIQLRSGKLASNGFDSSNTQVIVETDAVFRDVSSWYHCVVSVNGTAGTITFYINGVEQAQTVSIGSLVAGRSWDMLGYDSKTSFVISNSSSSYSFDGYLAEYHYIDGQALDATSFGETTNGVWVPKAYSGTYGTNGWYLSFANSAAIGDDLSGNTNDWTANNLAATDVMSGESPTNNFATINSIYRGSNTNTAAHGLTSEGNLKFSYSNNSDAGTLCTHPFSSGKYYWELRIVAGGGSSAYQHGTGIANVGAGYRKITNIMDGRDPGEIGMNSYTGAIKQGSNSSIGTLSTTAMPNGAIIGCAVDADNGAIYWSYNGTFMNSSDPTSGASKTNAHATWTPADEDMWVPTVNASGGTVPVHVINFGQDSTFAGAITAGGNADDNGYGDFKYAPPSGFLALCSANLPEVTIGPNSDTTGDEHFNTVLYTGTRATQSITGVGFQPDWVWAKRRAGVQEGRMTDSVRGVNAQLRPAATNAETTYTNALTSFDADGFTLGADSSNSYNYYLDAHVAWNWKASGTAVLNEDGTIDSQVSANPDAGFSIVTWVGNNTDGETVGHGLTDPEFSIVKNRDSGTNWDVCWSGFTSGTSLNLDTTAAEFSPTTGYQQLGTSTITLKNGGSGIGRVNGTPDDYVAYVFKSIPGYSAVGSYVGDGSTDGTFVYTGFRPAWVMVKRTDSTGNWQIWDATRNEYNVTNLYLRPNTADAEIVGSGGSIGIDITSNGFKFRSNATAWNASGGSYIYLAFAEAPFKYANAR